ncbi:hypothetical protein NG799_21085 [Laspinema sp. D1]|uniref:Uncharacterized protein n=1 Tax=Laspinema palackyanum D2a TaxID=2953684 RepID=A0ABT2MVS3_9CYAN|nr:hypothetical protein [Laspinema sp. D2a]
MGFFSGDRHLTRVSFFTLNCTSGPLPLPRSGLGWGSHCTSGPLPLARGGLGWGSYWAIATSRIQRRRFPTG